MLFKRVVALVALAAGFFGFVACLAGAYPISLLKARLDRVNERVFVTIDKGLASAPGRVREVQERVRTSKTGTSEIAAKLRDWRHKQGRRTARLGGRNQKPGRENCGPPSDGGPIAAKIDGLDWRDSPCLRVARLDRSSGGLDLACEDA